MQTQCPKCRRLFEIDDQDAGKEMPCPECGTKFFPRPYEEFDPDKTQMGIRHPHDRYEVDDVTMPGRRDRKPDGRFEPGDLIMRRYKVLAELGQGGMGVVYKCFDETAGIEVALKALPPELSHNTLEMEDIKENFQLVSKLVHQNIAISKTLELDNSNGNYYLIMECVEGEDLRRWIKRKRREGTLTLNDVLPVIRQVADALDYAHKEKIIHRDVKPGNIMINAEGDVKVLDFGLAAQIHTSMTRVSMAYHGTSGTGPYMAPEQWRGKAQGAAADQYALAVMTYEMLAGHLPFESTDVAVLKQAVLDERPDRIPGIRSSVQQALQRAMSKEPAERFAACSDFADALAGKRISGGRKHFDGKIYFGIAAAVLMAAGIGMAYWSYQKKQREIQLAEAAQLAERNRKAATQAAAAEAQKTENARLAEENKRAENARLAEENKRAENERRLEAERKKEQKKRKAQQLGSQAQTLSGQIKPEDFEQNQLFSMLYQDMQNALTGGLSALNAEDYDTAVQKFSFSQENANLITKQCIRKKKASPPAVVRPVTSDKNSTEELLNEARVRIAAKNWVEAHTCLKKVMQKDAANSDALALLEIYGQNFYAEAQQMMAQGAYRKAIVILGQMRPAVDAYGEYLLGCCYEKLHNREQAKSHMQIAAEQKNANALFWLGDFYSANGDKEKALDCFKRAAENGNTQAFLSLAIFYLDKSSPYYDEASGIKYMKTAAEAGVPAAQYNLGCCYAKFKGADYAGIPYNRTLAIQWLQRAKAGGITIAARALRRLEE